MQRVRAVARARRCSLRPRAAPRAAVLRRKRAQPRLRAARPWPRRGGEPGSSPVVSLYYRRQLALPREDLERASGDAPKRRARLSESPTAAMSSRRCRIFSDDASPRTAARARPPPPPPPSPAPPHPHRGSPAPPPPPSPSWAPPAPLASTPASASRSIAAGSDALSARRVAADLRRDV